MTKIYGTRNYLRSVEIRDVHIIGSISYVEHETTQRVEIRDVYITTLTKHSQTPFTHGEI